MEYKSEFQGKYISEIKILETFCLKVNNTTPRRDESEMANWAILYLGENVKLKF